MIAKINTGSNLYGALAYNQEKVDEGLEKILVGNNLKEVGIRLNEISANALTHGVHEPIGTLYGFTLLVKTETTLKEGFDIVQNRIFVKGAGEILYNYNNGLMATDPIIAAQNFIHALDSMPRLLEKYKSENERISKDIPVLKEVVEAVWRKEDELKGLKTELNNLERQIKLSLKPIEQTEGKSSEIVADNQLRQEVSKFAQSIPNGERTGVRCSFTS